MSQNPKDSAESKCPKAESKESTAGKVMDKLASGLKYVKGKLGMKTESKEEKAAKESKKAEYEKYLHAVNWSLRRDERPKDGPGLSWSLRRGEGRFAESQEKEGTMEVAEERIQNPEIKESLSGSKASQFS